MWTGAGFAACGKENRHVDPRLPCFSTPSPLAMLRTVDELLAGCWLLAAAFAARLLQGSGLRRKPRHLQFVLRCLISGSL